MAGGWGQAAVRKRLGGRGGRLPDTRKAFKAGGVCRKPPSSPGPLFGFAIARLRLGRWLEAKAGASHHPVTSITGAAPSWLWRDCALERAELGHGSAFPGPPCQRLGPTPYD
jgi:hypothetical protein